jgi:hypothetical protein
MPGPYSGKRASSKRRCCRQRHDVSKPFCVSERVTDFHRFERTLTITECRIVVDTLYEVKGRFMRHMDRQSHLRLLGYLHDYPTTAGTRLYVEEVVPV